MSLCLTVATVAMMACPVPKVQASKPILLAQNLQCGLQPIPPIGCKSAICICDQSGTRCRWEFVCN